MLILDAVPDITTTSRTRSPHKNKQELLGLIEHHRRGMVPLMVPMTLGLLKHHLKRNPVPAWVWEQVYLNPYPKELMLRNHV